jgi:hypothetical protein
MDSQTPAQYSVLSEELSWNIRKSAQELDDNRRED